MNIDCVIGIDPGAGGGIAYWRPNRNVVTIRMPKDIEDIDAYLRDMTTMCRPIIFLEKLSVRPDDVSAVESSANMGKLYRIQKMIANYEQLKTLIAINHIPYCMVHPLKWQNALNLRIKQKGFKEEKMARKRRFRDTAGQLYPEIKPTLWNGDAVLIMHFGRYALKNDMAWVRQNLPAEIQRTLF